MNFFLLEEHMISQLMKTWAGPLIAVMLVGAVVFGWVWLVLHNEVDAGLLMAALGAGGGVHLIHQNIGGNNGNAGASPPAP